MPRVAAGDTVYSLLTGAETGQQGTYGFQLVDVSDESIVVARRTTGTTELGGGSYVTSFTAPDDLGFYLPRWDQGTDAPPYADDDLVEVVHAGTIVDSPAGATFATRADVQTRLGRDLTDAEADQVDLLLILASGAMAEEANKDFDWIADLATIPTVLRIICIELVVRIILNPEALKSGSESLGAYSHSGTYAGSGLLELTEREGRLVRRAVHGRNSASVMVGSIFQETPAS